MQQGEKIIRNRMDKRSNNNNNIILSYNKTVSRVINYTRGHPTASRCVAIGSGSRTLNSYTNLCIIAWSLKYNKEYYKSHIGGI